MSEYSEQLSKREVPKNVEELKIILDEIRPMLQNATIHLEKIEKIDKLEL